MYKYSNLLTENYFSIKLIFMQNIMNLITVRPEFYTRVQYSARFGVHILPNQTIF